VKALSQTYTKSLMWGTEYTSSNLQEINKAATPSNYRWFLITGTLSKYLKTNN